MELDGVARAVQIGRRAAGLVSALSRLSGRRDGDRDSTVPLQPECARALRTKIEDSPRPVWTAVAHLHSCGPAILQIGDLSRRAQWQGLACSGVRIGVEGCPVRHPATLQVFSVNGCTSFLNRARGHCSPTLPGLQRVLPMSTGLPRRVMPSSGFCHRGVLGPNETRHYAEKGEVMGFYLVHLRQAPVVWRSRSELQSRLAAA